MTQQPLKITCSSAGVDFITQPSFDSFRAQPYLDSGGLWTIGYGSRIPGPHAYPSGITEEAAKTKMAEYLQQLCADLDRLDLGLQNQQQMDAIVSLVYNIGITTFVKSSLLPLLRKKDSGFVDIWRMYVHDQKRNVQQGLVKRREAELQLFIWGLYSHV